MQQSFGTWATLAQGPEVLQVPQFARYVCKQL